MRHRATELLLLQVVLPRIIVFIERNNRTAVPRPVLNPHLSNQMLLRVLLYCSNLSPPLSLPRSLRTFTCSFLCIQLGKTSCSITSEGRRTVGYHDITSLLTYNKQYALVQSDNAASSMLLWTHPVTTHSPTIYVRVHTQPRFKVSSLTRIA